MQKRFTVYALTILSITCGAALAAQLIAPGASSYMIASHRSQELGHAAVLHRLGLRPLLDLDLRLGEGTGAVLAIPLLEAAVRLLNEMATFEEAGVSEADETRQAAATPVAGDDEPVS